MGCDIHWIVQTRADNGSPWVTSRDLDADCYDGRNYDLFAQLANVRNGWGFAGTNTGEGFVPICEPRGLPGDLALVDNHVDEDTWLGDHSHSWLTLSELLAYDLDRVAVKYGVVDRATYESWDRKGAPSNWCSDVVGPKVVIISDACARAGEPSTYVRIAWSTSYRDAGGSFWSDFVPQLCNLGAPDNVRLVFGFDS